MIITPNTGLAPSAQSVAMRQPKGGSRSTVQTRGCYDSYERSEEPAGERRFQMELVSRLSREVRSMTTTGSVQELKEQISAGNYQIDAGALARRMLLQQEEA